MEQIHNDDHFWDRCKTCHYFEGYDICCHKSHWGAVGDDTLKQCEEKGSYLNKTEAEEIDKGWDIVLGISAIIAVIVIALALITLV